MTKQGKNKKVMTLETLGKIVQEGFGDAKKTFSTKAEIDALARMVARSFDAQSKKLGNRIEFTRSELRKDTASLRVELKGDIEILRRETQAEFREVRGEISALRDSVQALSVSVDKLVGAIDALRQEYAAIKVQLNRHERWIQQLAEKTHLQLEMNI